MQLHARLLDGRETVIIWPDQRLVFFCLAPCRGAGRVESDFDLACAGVVVLAARRAPDGWDVLLRNEADNARSIRNGQAIAVLHPDSAL